MDSSKTSVVVVQGEASESDDEEVESAGASQV